MEERIIYRADGDRAILMTPVFGCGLTVQQIAEKDVPAGRQWRVMLVGELPPFDQIDRWLWTDSGPLNVEQV